MKVRIPNQYCLRSQRGFLGEESPGQGPPASGPRPPGIHCQSPAYVPPFPLPAPFTSPGAGCPVGAVEPQEVESVQLGGADRSGPPRAGQRGNIDARSRLEQQAQSRQARSSCTATRPQAPGPAWGRLYPAAHRVSLYRRHPDERQGSGPAERSPPKESRVTNIRAAGARRRSPRSHSRSSTASPPASRDQLAASPACHIRSMLLWTSPCTRNRKTSVSHTATGTAR